MKNQVSKLVLPSETYLPYSRITELLQEMTTKLLKRSNVIFDDETPGNESPNRNTKRHDGNYKKGAAMALATSFLPNGLAPMITSSIIVSISALFLLVIREQLFI